MANAVLMLVALVAAAGCQNPPAPPPPPAVRSSIEPARTAPATPPIDLDRLVAYGKSHPWGEHTGGARLRGTMLWGEDGQPPVPVPRRRLVLKGIDGTPTEGIYYRIRANDQGEFVFDHIQSGQFKLSDDAASGFHWRLRISIAEKEDRVLDLTPANSIAVRDDFAEDGT